MSYAAVEIVAYHHQLGNIRGRGKSYLYKSRKYEIRIQKLSIQGLGLNHHFAIRET